MERRNSLRKAIDATAYLYYQGKRVTRRCKVLNISSDGLYLEMKPHTLHRGRRIELVFPIPTSRSVIKLRRLSGIIIRVTHDGAAVIIRKRTLSARARYERSIKGRRLE